MEAATRMVSSRPWVGMWVYMTSRSSVWKPRSTAESAKKLRESSAAPTASMTESETSAITKALRRRPC